ncbi:hypothetical protein CLAIMM_04390 [Cladophialophora immunda]|nr:hypothetical protein CLAIMM_04390 [Cladophialophora immunda]
MPARNRPAKRVLNRWSDDLDKGVLLCVQYACAEAGLKIPWGRVAALMGPTFTEGSIVQHLAKLRNLMARLGIPVPPAVKRGMVTKEPSKIYTNAGNKVKLEPIAPMFPEAPVAKEDGDGEASIYDKPKRSRKKETVQDKDGQAKKEPKAKGKAKGKAKDLSDSDDEYPAPKKRRHNSSKSKKKEAVAKASATLPDAAIPSAVSPIQSPGAEKNVAVKLEEEELAGPARRTRGIKRDYSVMAAPSDDDAEFDEEVPPNMDEDLEGCYEDIGIDDETAHSASNF